MYGWDVCMAGGACTARGVCDWRTHVCIGEEPCWGHTLLGGGASQAGGVYVVGATPPHTVSKRAVRILKCRLVVYVINNVTDK